MKSVYYPPNSFRYKIIHSFFSNFLGINNYLMIKDICYSHNENNYNKKEVCFIAKLSKLYSMIFYSRISNKFEQEIKDYRYIFDRNINYCDFTEKIYCSNDICSILAKLMTDAELTDVQDLAFYYFLAIKKLHAKIGYYITLPVALSYNIQDEIKNKECVNIRYYIEGQLSVLWQKEKKQTIAIGDLQHTYEHELSSLREKIEKITLFGSIARNEYTIDSDIDLIVYVKKMRTEEISAIINKIKSINIIYFNKKSDIHIVHDNYTNKVVFEGESYEVF